MESPSTQAPPRGSIQFVRATGLMVIMVTSTGCSSSTTTDARLTDSSVETDPLESSIPPETGDTGRDHVIEPTPSGCDKVPTVPAYTGGAACTTAVANTCDCAPIAKLAWGSVYALGGITPKGDAIIQLFDGTTWSCPETIAGGPWVQIEWLDRRVVLRDLKGALFYVDLASVPFSIPPVQPIVGAETDLPFEGAVPSNSVLYARRSDGAIESRGATPTGFAAPVATGATTTVAFSSASGALAYAHADGFVHYIDRGTDHKTTMPAGGSVTDLYINEYGFAPYERHTMVSMDSTGRIQTDWPGGCPAELCRAQFIEWQRWVRGSFRTSTLAWTRDGRSFRFTPNNLTGSAKPAEPVEEITDEPVLFRRTLFGTVDETRLYARASDCGLRLVESGLGATGIWHTTSVVPRTVLAKPPSLVRTKF